MAISFTRTFANLTSALLSYLDDNFNDINTFLGTATGVQTTAAANKIPLADSNGVLPAGWSRTLCNALFGAIGVGVPQYTGLNSVSSASEIAVGSLMITAGAISHLSVKAQVNTASAGCVFTVRKNGVDTALTITIGAGSTTMGSDNADRVTFTSGDIITIKASLTSGTGSLQNVLASVVVEGV